MSIIPKSPFSERKTEPIEVKKERLLFQKPHHKYHNFYGIQWLKQRKPKNIEKQSIFSLLPDNGKPVVSAEETPEEKKKRLLHEHLDRNWKIDDTPENDIINPKYGFNESTYEKILKLKSVFIEFDEDGSRKMEGDEMVEMFNSNNIKATLEEGAELFFKGQTIKHKDIESLGLNFYDFMMFSLKKHEDFRTFMRKVKQQMVDDYNKKQVKTKESYREMETNKTIEKPHTFIPMSFERILDYFNVKGKERASKEKIGESIKKMNHIMTKNNPTEKNYKFYDNQGKDINLEKIFEEFNNLFNYNYSLDSHGNSQQSQGKTRRSSGITNNEMSLFITPIKPNTSMNNSGSTKDMNKKTTKPFIKDIILEKGTKPFLKLRKISLGMKNKKGHSRGSSTGYDSMIKLPNIGNKNNSSINLHDRSYLNNQKTTIADRKSSNNIDINYNRKEGLLLKNKERINYQGNQQKPKELNKFDFVPKQLGETCN